MNRVVVVLKSKTFWAGVIAAAGVLLNADHITAGTIAQAGGIVLAAVGIKDNFHKLSVGEGK